MAPSLPHLDAERGGGPASAGARLGGALIDLFVTAAVLGIGAACALPLAQGCKVPGCEVVVLVGPAIALVLLLGMQTYFFVRGGQTLGKRATGIAVVRADGAPAGIGRGLFLRLLPLVVIPGAFFGIGNWIWKTASDHAATSELIARFGYNELDSLTTSVPIVASLVFLVADLLPILFGESRALHDRIAGTSVARKTPARR